MDIINFSSQEFQEIPTQDNPAFSHRDWDYQKLGPSPKNRCLMLVKAHSYHNIGSPGVSVIEIDNPENKHDRVLSLGTFYTEENATLFAEAYASRIGGL